MKIEICSIVQLVFLCLMSGILGAIGVTPTDWQLWVILCSAIGLYVCGAIIGKESYEPKSPLYIDGDYDLPICPNCKIAVDETNNFCSVCGQAIYWE